MSELILLLGPPGTGKTTFCVLMNWRHPTVISLDDYRSMCTDDPHASDANSTALAIQGLVLEQRLSRGLRTVIDSTSYHRATRALRVATARRHGRPVVMILFHTPLDTCRNRSRTIPKPEFRATVGELAEHWQRLDRDADLVVHVSPIGDRLVSLAPVPPALRDADWLHHIETVNNLPWPTAYPTTA